MGLKISPERITMKFWRSPEPIPKAGTAAARTKLTLRQKMGRSLVGGLLLCSLAVGAVSYAPPIPKAWNRTVHRQDQVMRQVFHGETDKSTLEKAADRAASDVRLVPLSETLYYQYGKKSTLHGITSAGPAKTLHVPYFPHTSIMLNRPEAYAHEWVHANYPKSINSCATAAAVTDYFHKKLQGVKLTKVRKRNGRLEYAMVQHFPKFGKSNGKRYLETTGTRYFDPEDVDRQFKTLKPEDHNRLFNPGMELGVLARFEEHRCGKPGLGLFLIREVSLGKNVENALKEVHGTAIENERRKLLKNHPWLAK